jgi:hypothetical protein
MCLKKYRYGKMSEMSKIDNSESLKSLTIEDLVVMVREAILNRENRRSQ